MFDFPIKQRKLTTYGKKASQTTTYRLARDDVSPEKPKRTPSIDFNIGTSSTTKERTQPTQEGGKLVRPSSKKRTETNWDVPSSDDEPGPSLKFPSIKPAKAAEPKLHVSKHSRAKSVPQHDIIGKEAQYAPYVDKKRKREIVTRATSEAPRPAVKKVDVFQAPVQEEKAPPRGKSVEPGRLARPRPPTLSKKKEEIDIFDFPVEDEDRAVAKKPKPVKSRESSQPPRKRARTPAAESQDFALSRTRGRTKTPESRQRPNTVHKAKSRATTPVPSKHNAMRKLQDQKVLPKPSRQLAGVGWQPNLVIHSSPKRKLNKGASAPAGLFSMIREQPQSPPTDSSDNLTTPATPNLDFDEMDIDATSNTPPLSDLGSPLTVRGTASQTPAQTPRQRQLWGQLLQPDMGESPSDLPISKLKLTSSRKIPSLPLSASDIPQTTYTKRGRLIDNLKASAPILEEDEELDDGDTVMEPSPEPFVSQAEKGLVQSNSPIKTTSTKVTYAQQRTFLEEQNEEAMYDILAEELGQHTNPFGSQSQHNIDEELEEPEDSQEAHPRGVHDLRAAGSKRRLHDSLDHLVNDVEGMAVSSVSARRSALMELVEKLMEPSAVSLFLDSGMDLRLVKSFEDVTDTTFTFLAATSVALMADAGASLNTLNRIHQSKAFLRIVGLLNLEQDIAKVVKERRSNMSKMAQASVIDFKEKILNSKLFAKTSPEAYSFQFPKTLSPQSVALRCLDSVVRKLRQHGSQSILLDRETIGTLLQVAQSRATQGTSDIPTLELAISILEAHTVTPSIEKKSTGWSTDLVKAFVRLLPSLFDTNPALQHCNFLALRLSMNLTNENSAASDTFGSGTVTKLLVQSIIKQYSLLTVNVGSEGQETILDLTILSLGVMINLAEHSDLVRLSIIDGGDELLFQTVRLFLDGKELAEQADSVEQTQTNVAFGYLAFMLGNLCQNQTVRIKVRAKLPGGNMKLLLDEMQTFTKMHRSVDKARFDGAEGQELESGHTQRLQALVDSLKAFDS